METMDELIIKALTGRAEPIDERRLARWRAEDPMNEEHVGDVAAIWQAAATPVDEIGAPAVPHTVEIVRKGEALRVRRALRQALRGLGRRATWPWAAAAVLAMIGVVGWLGREGGRPGVLAGTEFVAGADEGTTVALSDGSVVRLDAGSSVRFAGGDARREAWLTGRAFFGVAADPERSFIVHTDLGDATAIGTRFEVRSRDGELRVVVLEGRVAVVSTRGRSAEAERSQVVVVSANGDFSLTTAGDVHALLDWNAGTLIFQATPVGQVAEELGEHFGVEVAVADTVSGRTVTAWFGDEPLEEVVGSICLLIQADCEVGDARVVIGS